jgi:hypothetical protein
MIVERRDKLRARREEILGELDMTIEQFRELAATVTLSGAELDRLEELEEIAFLLGDAA